MQCGSFSASDLHAGMGWERLGLRPYSRHTPWVCVPHDVKRGRGRRMEVRERSTPRVTSGQPLELDTPLDQRSVIRAGHATWPTVSHQTFVEQLPAGHYPCSWPAAFVWVSWMWEKPIPATQESWEGSTSTGHVWGCKNQRKVPPQQVMSGGVRIRGRFHLNRSCLGCKNHRKVTPQQVMSGGVRIIGRFHLNRSCLGV